MSIDMLTSQLCDQFKNLSLNEKTEVAAGSHTLAKSALQHYSEKNFSEFDALVGDAACQVRAIMVATFAQKEEIMEQSRKDLEKVGSCLKAIEEKSANHTCSCVLAKESILLTKMHILKTTRSIHKIELKCGHCDTQIPTFKERIEPKLIIPLYKTKTKSQKVVDSCSQSLSQFGIAFLQEEAKSASSEVTQKMISQENVLVLNQRQEIPCFYSIQAIMDIAQKKHIPLLIKVKKLEHALEKSHDDPFDTVILQKNETKEAKTDDPLIVIEGMRISDEAPESYKTKLLGHNIVHLIHCNAAQHAQYTGNKGLESVPLMQKELFLEEKTRIETLANEAKILGCSDKNRSLFCITHIFCDTINGQMKAGVKL